MKKLFIIIILILTSLIGLSGCLNPIKEVPVIKINVSYTERQGIAEADRFSFVGDKVSYINRPKKTQADSFPAIVGRATIIKTATNDNEKVNETIIGPWETLPYKGDGSYSFNIGFEEGKYPTSGDIIHISIMVVDKDGQRIGYIVENMIWK